MTRISLFLILVFSCLNIFSQNDSISWQHHFQISAGLSTSQLNPRDDVFKDKDRFNRIGLESSFIYGYNIANIIGVHTGFEFKAVSSSINKNFDSTNYRLEESFLRFPLMVSITVPVRCFNNCKRTLFFQLSGGTYMSFSSKQNIGEKDLFASTEIEQEWGYRKTGTIMEFKFILSNTSNDKQGFGANHVFGVRLTSDKINSATTLKSGFRDNGFVTPYYNTISVYYNIINAFAWKNYNKKKVKFEE